MITNLAKDNAPREKIMYVAPLAVLSDSRMTTDSEDAVMISRVALEALLRSAFPGLSADDSDTVSYLSRYLDSAPIVEDHTWRDELTRMVQLGFEGEWKSENSLVDVQWFDDVEQAIDSGAISEAPLSLVDYCC
jgi:hypothetical protein